MEIRWTDQATLDLHKFDKNIRTRIYRRILELEEKGPAHSDVEIFKLGDYDLYRLKMKNNQLDHRAIFEFEGEEILLFGIFHRDRKYGYISDKIGERLRS